MWNPKVPFNDLPPPPTEELETISVMRATIEARAALASLNQAIKTIPDPGVLVSAIPLLEAQASSEVENIVTTTDDLFRHMVDREASATPETKETLRYRSALYQGASLVAARPAGTTLAVQICTEIRAVETGLRDLPGTYIGSPTTGRIIYTPPDGKRLLERKMGEWEQFLHADNMLDPLVKMAAAHYQFEAIHPFPDGNGRTGRILNVLLLLEYGLLDQPVLYLSRFIIRNKEEYYRRLLAVTAEGEWEEWLLFMLSAVEETSKQTLAMITSIQRLREEFREEMRAWSAGANADLLDLVFERPYSRISGVIEKCDVSRPTATKWLRELVAAGLLRETKVGRQGLFINARLIEILQQG